MKSNINVIKSNKYTVSLVNLDFYKASLNELFDPFIISKENKKVIKSVISNRNIFELRSIPDLKYKISHINLLY